MNYNVFVGNGHDRSGIGVLTDMINKISIEYEIQQSEPEQASRFPTNPF